MGDRSSNLLIVLILLIIIALGGLYVFKVISSENQISDMRREETSSIPFGDTSTSGIDIQSSTAPKSNITIPTPQNGESAAPTATPTQIKMGYKYNNKYYYNQLEEPSKAIYDALESNIDNLYTGNYVINIDYDFSKILVENGGSQLLDKYYNDAVNALNLDIPNLFYVNFSKMWLNIETTTTIFSTKHKLNMSAKENETYYSNTFKTSAQVIAAYNEVERIKDNVIKTATGSNYNKLKIVHDWIIDYLEYDSSSSNRGNVYGAFWEEKAVCEGYARAYKYILDELGIYNVLIVGTGTNSNGVTEEHMWNYIKLDDTWYAVDCTWDDPIVTGGGRIGYDVKHEYFLVGSEILFKNHVERRNISSSGKQFVLPPLGKYKY